MPAPPGSMAAAQDPEAYAFALLYPDLQVGAAGLYTETPDPRLGVFWRGLREEAPGTLEALRAEPRHFDLLWLQVVRFPQGR